MLVEGRSPPRPPACIDMRLHFRHNCSHGNVFYLWLPPMDAVPPNLANVNKAYACPLLLTILFFFCTLNLQLSGQPSKYQENPGISITLDYIIFLVPIPTVMLFSTTGGLPSSSFLSLFFSENNNRYSYVSPRCLLQADTVPRYYIRM